MVQQQLVDYIKSQLKVGATREEIRSNLLGAGWTSVDVDDSMKAAESGGGVSAGTPIAVSDLISSNSKLEAVVSVNKAAKKTATSEKKEDKKAGLPKAKMTRTTIVIAVLAVVAAGAAGAAVFFYLNSRSLNDRITALSQQNDSMNSKISVLNSQVSDLTANNNDLNSQVASLTSLNAELQTSLSFLIAPPSVSSTTEVPVEVKGILGVLKSQYVLVNAEGVKVYIINSKDSNVDAALKPLVGSSAVISGTHYPGSPNVTVTSVNGVSLQQSQ
jgi:cell division protein FtsL